MTKGKRNVKTNKDKIKYATAGLTEPPNEDHSLWTANINLPGHLRAINMHESTQALAEEMGDIIIKLLHSYEAPVDQWREELGARQAGGERFDYYSTYLEKWDTSNKKWTFKDPRDTKDRFRPHDPEAWREENHKKQAAGARFEKLWYDGEWHAGHCDFTGNKENYREVPQEEFDLGEIANSLDTKPKIPHIKERILWLQQRAAGTNEVWQVEHSSSSGGYVDIAVDTEPAWSPQWKYRVKPKMVKHYFALVESSNKGLDALAASTKERLNELTRRCDCTIIGKIEEREVEI